MADVAELTELIEAGDTQALAARLWTMPLDELEQLAKGPQEDADGM